MEKEEIKENTSNDKKEDCCGHHKYSHGCMVRKCHMIKMLGFLIIIIIAFCFGSFFGRMHAHYEGYGYFGSKNNEYMMDGWNIHKERATINTPLTVTKQITVGVKDAK